MRRAAGGEVAGIGRGGSCAKFGFGRGAMPSDLRSERSLTPGAGAARGETRMEGPRLVRVTAIFQANVVMVA